MSRRPVCRFIAVGVVAVSAFSHFGGIAHAQGKPAKVTLSCTNGVVDATATVQLLSTTSGPAASDPLTVDCKTGTVMLKGSSSRVDYASYSISQLDPAAGSCSAAAAIRPLTIDCGTGVRLTMT